jgi:hypothetical protein
VSFVNSDDEDEQRKDLAASGQLIDFDPNDPDVVKVHYDLAAWNFDQRAELSEALASAELPHSWEGDELVIPESAEAVVDELFERFDEELGPFPIVLADDDPATNFDLDEWSVADRNALSEALITAQIPHRWSGTTVHVISSEEQTVDELLDQIEAGELVIAEGEEAPEGALSTIFVSGQIDPARPPFGVAVRAWSNVVNSVNQIVELVIADSENPRGIDESEMIGLAQDLRSLVRPLV